MRNEMEKARNLLEALTPLLTDCGMQCQAACCRPDEDGQGGVTLFPGEESAYLDADWAHVEDGVLTCDGRCPRENRPLGCRIFPLTPYRSKMARSASAWIAARFRCVRLRRTASAR